MLQLNDAWTGRNAGLKAETGLRCLCLASPSPFLCLLPHTSAPSTPGDASATTESLPFVLALVTQLLAAVGIAVHAWCTAAPGLDTEGWGWLQS